MTFRSSSLTTQIVVLGMSIILISGCNRQSSNHEPAPANSIVEVTKFFRLQTEELLGDPNIQLTIGDGFHIGLALSAKSSRPATYEDEQVSDPKLWACECFLFPVGSSRESQKTLRLGVKAVRFVSDPKFKQRPPLFSKQVHADPDFTFKPQNLNTLKSAAQGHLPYWTYLPGNFTAPGEYVLEIVLYPCFTNISPVRSEKGPPLLIERRRVQVISD